MSFNRRNDSIIGYNSPVVLSFVFISLLILLVDSFFPFLNLTYRFFCVYRSPISVPFFVRLFGHVLGHSGWEHYINNMMMMLLVGPMLEEKYGSKVLLQLIALTALVTGLLNILLFNSGLLGASGIVFMMIVLSSVTSAKQGQIPLTLIIVVVLYLGQQILSGLFSADNISQLTHIVGGLLGAIYGMNLRR